MLTLLVAWRAASRIGGDARRRAAAEPGRRITAFYMPTRLLAGRHARRRARRWPTSSASPCTRSRSRRPIDREVEATRRPCSADDRAGPMTRAERAGAPARPAHVELGQHLRRAVPADRRHEREGGRLHHHRRRSRGRAVGDRQRAEDGGRSPCSSGSHARFGFAGIAATLATEPGPELADAPGGRGRADALPGARRLPAPLRRREAVAATRWRRGAAPRLFPDRSRRAARRPARRSSRACSPSRSTSGCSRRSRCTSARSTSIASARCSCRWCSARSGDRTRGWRLALNARFRRARARRRPSSRRSGGCRLRPRRSSDVRGGRCPVSGAPVRPPRARRW